MRWDIYLNRGGSLREGRVKGSPRPEAGGFFYWGHVGTFLALFFVSFFNIVFIGIFFDFGMVWEAKMAPKIDFWRAFWLVFLGPSFLIDFISIFVLS